MPRDIDEDDIPNLSDSIPDVPIMNGKVIGIDEVLNVSLVFTKWSITKSKWKDSKGEPKPLLTLQFKFEGKTRILWTSAAALVKQIRLFQENCPDATYFKATIKHVDGKFYKFFK